MLGKRTNTRQLLAETRTQHPASCSQPLLYLILVLLSDAMMTRTPNADIFGTAQRRAQYTTVFAAMNECVC